MGIDSPAVWIPRFKAGEPVRGTGPGPHRNKEGRVVRVIKGSLHPFHRYHVNFSDGSASICFGFELELLERHEKCA